VLAEGKSNLTTEQEKMKIKQATRILNRMIAQ
jgi:hypothetical protein